MLFNISVTISNVRSSARPLVWIFNIFNIFNNINGLSNILKWRSLQFLIFLIIWRFWLWFSQNNTFFQYNMNRHIEKHGFLQSNQWKLWNFQCKRKPRHRNIEISLCLQWTFSDFDSFDNGKSWFSYVLFIFHWKYVCFKRNHSQNLWNTFRNSTFWSSGAPSLRMVYFLKGFY